MYSFTAREIRNAIPQDVRRDWRRKVRSIPSSKKVQQQPAEPKNINEENKFVKDYATFDINIPDTMPSISKRQIPPTDKSSFKKELNSLNMTDLYERATQYGASIQEINDALENGRTTLTQLIMELNAKKLRAELETYTLGNLFLHAANLKELHNTDWAHTAFEQAKTQDDIINLIIEMQ